MNKKFFETKEFKKLNSEWELKLKMSGFVDVETRLDKDFNQIHSQEFTINEEYVVYNQRCLNYLATGKIVDELDLFIFSQHCEGKSNVHISELLRINNLKPLFHSSVKRRIDKILAAAEITPIFFNI